MTWMGVQQKNGGGKRPVLKLRLDPIFGMIQLYLDLTHILLGLVFTLHLELSSQNSGVQVHHLGMYTKAWFNSGDLLKKTPNTSLLLRTNVKVKILSENEST